MRSTTRFAKFLVAGLVVCQATVGATQEGWGLNSILTPGMIFRDLLLPLNSHTSNDHRSLKARRADVGEVKNLLQITALEMTGGASPRKFQLHAPTAEYDLNEKVLTVRSGFFGKALGMEFEGDTLHAQVQSPSFQVGGHFEVHLSGSVISSSIPKRSAKLQSSLELVITTPQNGMAAMEPRTLESLVSGFAGNLGKFYAYWSWIEDHCSPGSFCRPAKFTMVGDHGGEVDVEQFSMSLAGPSAIIGPLAVLVSSGGLQVLHESIDGDELMRITGQSDVRSWFQGAESSEIWIHSSSFEYVSDRRTLQFEGGPLTLERDGVTLKACESWQFVRVFDGGRIVLGPGAWNVIGNLQ